MLARLILGISGELRVEIFDALFLKIVIAAVASSCVGVLPYIAATADLYCKGNHSIWE
jgi:hypothetical protein